HEMALEASPLAAQVLRLVEPGGNWEGTAAELHHAVRSQAESFFDSPPRLPQTPQQLGSALRRIAPNLRALGIEVEFGRQGHGGQRIITIRRRGPLAAAA